MENPPDAIPPDRATAASGGGGSPALWFSALGCCAALPSPARLGL